MQKLTGGILTSYEVLLSTSSSSSLPSLTQNRSLQLWFDVKFLMNLLLRKDDTEVRSREIAACSRFPRGRLLELLCQFTCLNLYTVSGKVTPENFLVISMKSNIFKFKSLLENAIFL